MRKLKLKKKKKTKSGKLKLKNLCKRCHKRVPQKQKKVKKTVMMMKKEKQYQAATIQMISQISKFQVKFKNCFNTF